MKITICLIISILTGTGVINFFDNYYNTYNFHYNNTINNTTNNTTNNIINNTTNNTISSNLKECKSCFGNPCRSCYKINNPNLYVYTKTCCSYCGGCME